jgi:hypothetical protein
MILCRVLSPSAQLQYITVRIVGVRKDGSSSIGTGFFFEFKVDEQSTIPVIVTNRHVVKDCVEGQFFLHEATTPLGEPRRVSDSSFNVNLDNFENRWLPHATEDLCVMPFEPVRAAAAAQGKDVFWLALDESLVAPKDVLAELMALEDIVMVGYPIGLWDSINNLPILRRGVTASHPSTDWQGKPIGVIDIGVYPGSSGSPVLIMNVGMYATVTGTTIGARTHFLGVLSSGPVHHADGRIVIQTIPTGSLPVAKTAIHVHLGFYIKAKELLAMRPMLFALIRR